jgi:protease-4
MSFLRSFLASLLALFTFLILVFFFFVGIVSSLDKKDVPVVEENSVMYMKMSGVVSERTIEDPLQDIFPESSPRVIGLYDVLDALQAAKEDEKIKGIYLEPQYLQSGWASLEEIRSALIDFKSSGKFIYAYGEFVSEKDYYLTSVADTFYLNPQGSLEWNGLSINVTFWKGLFDKLEIEPEIFRVGEFKSYVEPFQQKKMSPENRLQLTEMLSSIYDTYLDGIASSTGKPIDDLSNLANELSIYLPADAEANGLVTKLAYEDEIKGHIMDRVGEEDIDDVNFISFSNYAKTVSSEYSKNRIAVIVAEGEVVMGSSEDRVVAADRFVRELRKARENSSVKAIVLRVNSPGGSLTASDMIWREIERTKGEKPIIASFGDVAASGGYYISMLCDTIVAQPNTITGSIGIFGMLFNLEDFLDKKLGITNDVVKTSDYADLITVTRPLNDFEKSVIQNGVEKGYDTFVTKAAEGRGMSLEELKAIAGGRVWTGTQAKENGLVDVLGGLSDAITIAAEAAGVEEDYRIRVYPVERPFIEQLMGRLGNEVKSRVMEDHIFAPYAEDLKALSRMNGIQVRLPMEFEMN